MLINIDFLDRILLKPKALSVFYVQLKNKITNSVMYANESSTPLDFNKKAYLFNDVPDYIEPTIATSNNIKFIKLNTYKGSMINLTNYSNLKDYLTKHFNAKKRSQFNTYKKRLEKCFNISYKVYFGSIEKIEYDRLFNKFPEMIKKRFDLLGTEHYDLSVWDRYEQNGYELINKKRACLFVIYDGNTPISISLTPVMGKVLYGFVRGFDVHYSKFYLGFTDLIFQLEWCFNNNMEIFDLVKGSYSYKTKFTNSTYYFQKQIAFDPKYLRSSISAFIKAFKIKSFYFIIKLLKKVNIDNLYHSYINKNNKEKEEVLKQTNINYKYKTIPLNIDDDISKLDIVIDLFREEYDFLRKPVYNILYTLQEPITSITIYKENEEIFILKGIKKSYKITVAKAF
ncbi:hypothetical protein [Cellulophaga fucicola]|uniref:hypothetical protein n=1 Tax=Cellulophaga fucicola TaxID=76595 RepID=UPI003EBB19E1